jgi:hypothetical protein
MSAGVKLLIGTVSGGNLTSGSMAEAIYNQMLIDAPLRAGEEPLPRQRFAIAIATGVINHLVANGAAFTVDVRDGGPNPIIREVQIDKWP